MSRIRYLKPGFFTDEDLADCSHLARLLFAGLWTIADREGRLEDRPRRIRAEVLPYDDCDTDALLRELADHGPLILRYIAEGTHYICIPGWGKHQKPHSKEVPSTIPEPTEHDLGSAQARPRQCEDTTKVDTSTASRAPVMGNGQRVTGNGDSNGDGEDLELLSDSDESNGMRNIPAEFEVLWREYGGVGNRGKALDCYRWWRQFGHAAADELLAAVRNYVAHCQGTGSKIMHASTFLARSYPPTKNHPGKSARWPEWASGEEHGTMDARATRNLSDVLTATAQAFGLIGDEYERLGAAEDEEDNGPKGTPAGGEDAECGLPASELAG